MVALLHFEFNYLSPIIIFIIVFIAIGFAQSNCHLYECHSPDKCNNYVNFMNFMESTIHCLWSRNVFSVQAFIALAICNIQIFYRSIHHMHECIHLSWYFIRNGNRWCAYVELIQSRILFLMKVNIEPYVQCSKWNFKCAKIFFIKF